MKRFCLLLVLALVLLPSASALGYRWYQVPLGDDIELPVYEIAFGTGEAYAGTEDGVYRGYGLAGGWEGMGFEYPGLGAYSIHYRQGVGWVKNTINALALPGATGVAVGDVFDSGYADIVVAAKDGSDAVVCYQNPLPDPATPFWTAHEIDGVADGAREVFVADLDRDYDLDVVVAVRDENRIVWYENSVASPTDPWLMYEVGVLGAPRGVYVADINGDQRLDIAASGMADNAVVWYEAPLDPRDPWPCYAVDDSLEAVKGVFAADVDLDGDLDLLAAGREAGDVVWYEHGDLTYPPIWTKHFIDTELAGAVNVWCGDLFGDELPEVVATAKYAGWVVVYRQTDDTSDIWERTLVDGDLPEACPLSAADIDGDGRTDIVAAGRAAELLAWYSTPSESGLNWQRHVVDDAAGHSMGLTTGDLDNDGDAEIVATACPEGTVTVYWNDLRDILCAFSEGSGYCESDGIYRWHDLDQGWSPVFWCPRPYFITEHPLTPGWFFCGNHDGFFGSTDLNLWYELGAGVLPDTVRSCWFHPDASNIMMVGTNRGIYRTTDSGLNWDPVNDEVPPLPGLDIETAQCDCCPPPCLHVFAAVGMGSFSDGIFRSDDLGDNWLRLNVLPEPTDLVKDITWAGPPPTLAMFVGTRNDGILQMDFDGQIVGDLNVGLPGRTIHRMRYDPFIDTPALFACTGVGLFECLLLEPSGVEPGPAPADRLCTAWPNPSRSDVMFSLKGLASGRPVRLRVFDIAGREVWSQESYSSGAGPLTLQWNGHNSRGQPVPSGIYFYRAESAGQSFTGKVVRVR